MTDTLLGHLALFASFFGQGELLCTQGLGYLLNDDERARAFEALLGDRSERAHSIRPLRWRAEWSDGTGRTDLVGFDGTTPTVIVEAKLTAQFGDGQLKSYATTLRDGGAAHALLVALAPTDRLHSANAAIETDLGSDGRAPLGGTAPNVAAVALSWEDVFDRLLALGDDSSGDLAQLRGLYNALVGLDIAPFEPSLPEVSPDAETLRQIIDLATQSLTNGRHHDLLPMADRGGYFCRYVCRCVDGSEPCFAIGRRRPFVGHETYLWMRYHHTTPKFYRVNRRVGDVERAGLGPVVRSGGDLWIPFDIDLANDPDPSDVAQEVAERAEAIEAVIWPVPPQDGGG